MSSISLEDILRAIKNSIPSHCANLLDQRDGAFGLQNGLHHQLTCGIHHRDHYGCLMNIEPNILFIVHEGAPFCRS